MAGEIARTTSFARWDTYLGYDLYGVEVRYRDGTSGLEFAVGIPGSESAPPRIPTLQAAREHCDQLGPTPGHVIRQRLLRLVKWLRL